MESLLPCGTIQVSKSAGVDLHVPSNSPKAVIDNLLRTREIISTMNYGFDYSFKMRKIQQETLVYVDETKYVKVKADLGANIVQLLIP